MEFGNRMTMQLVNQDVIQKLSDSLIPKKPNYVIICYDIPSEFRKVSKKEKTMLIRKRVSFKIFTIDKYCTYISNSVYLINYKNLSKLIDDFENCYSEIANNYNVDLKILGLVFDLDLVLKAIVDNIDNTIREIKNYSDYCHTIDVSKITKKELYALRRKYKHLVRKLNIIRNYRVEDLRELNKNIANQLEDKLYHLSKALSRVTVIIGVWYG